MDDIGFSDRLRSGEGTRPAAVIAFAVFAWLFAFKMLNFFELTYADDMINTTQASRSWLEGRFLYSNHYGAHLSTHTHFFLAPLGPIAKLFGAPGLFFALSAFWAAAVYFSARILAGSGVPSYFAALVSPLLLLTPQALFTFHDQHHGMHAELFLPPLAIFLLYNLLRDRPLASFVSALVIISVKEDAPIMAGTVAGAVFLDYLFSGIRSGRKGSLLSHRCAALVMITSLIAVPVLLSILAFNKTNPLSFSNLPRLARPGVNGYASLGVALLTHLPELFRSYAAFDWLVAGVGGSFGLILLRPHFLPLGLLNALTSWAFQDDLYWAPRFAPSLGFIWCVTLLSAASLFNMVTRLWKKGSGRNAALPGAVPRSRLRVAAIGIAAFFISLAFLCGLGAFKIFRTSRFVYSLSPDRVYSAEEVMDARLVGERYRELARRDEPVVSARFLGAFAHDRDYWWYDRLIDAPEPVWAIWDDEEEAPRKEDSEKFDRLLKKSGRYGEVIRRGRFALYRLTPPRFPERPSPPSP